ncbi:hypothetical protein MPDQ_006667 [Monascus purpureus]|uniref:C2H2-type domain-containing protein n=1 Tax=Monascus purpureus TaxID=5098 RepID=A0A507QTZ2_MONPU|nr:hypothetical protein MPDQ_006667 [Monascus purpureus]BDD54800.1 hypothetical protein MAP00_000382 [Monascus purpureus]
MADSPGSPLSSINLEDDDSSREDIKYDPQRQSPSTPNTNMPPSKRRRTGVASWDCQTPLSSVQDDILPTSPSSTISSDTSGEIPNSPSTLALLGASQDDDYSGQGTDQVTVCRWEGCDAGDMGNMDDLVEHIRNEHVGGRQKKYLCEWVDCSRKGQTHASGYALRAHMRSHTREKPFYCTLPECDRSFTRSDALAKHMRTVHETEALRPSDPIPKLAAGSAASGKTQRIKLKLSQPSKDSSDTEQQSQQPPPPPSDLASDLTALEDFDLSEFGPELGFDAHELSLRPYDLYRLLRRQIHWAEQESVQLRAEWEHIRPKRQQAWRKKEAIFDDVMDAELRLFSAMVGTSEPNAEKNAHAPVVNTDLGESTEQQQREGEDAKLALSEGISA